MNTVYLVIQKAQGDNISIGEWNNLVLCHPELTFSETDTLEYVGPDGQEFTSHAVTWAGDPDSTLMLVNGKIHVEGMLECVLDEAIAIATALNAIIVRPS